MNSINYDIVIVGGGATGLSLLLGLYPYLKDGYLNSILLVEKENETKYLPGRSIALNQNTLEYFNSLPLPINALKYLAQNLKPIKNILVKNQGYKQSLILEAHKHYVDQFGGVIDLSNLQNDLLNLAQYIHEDLKNYNPQVQIDIAFGTNVIKTTSGFDQSGDYRILELEDLKSQRKETISTKLAIIANGAKHIDGLENYQASLKLEAHQQFGVIADVELSAPLNNLAIEYFTPQGPIAFLPKSDYQACIVYCTNQEYSYAQLETQGEQIIEQLNQSLKEIGEHTLEKAINVKDSHDQKLALQNMKTSTLEPIQKHYISKYSKMMCFRLDAQLQTKLHDLNLVYLGNAAHTLHPVSGQGFNLGVLSIQNFLKALTKVKAISKDGFKQSANLIAQEYHYEHFPVATEVFNRTNLLAKEFSQQATFGETIPNLGLYHLINYTFLQDLIVSPSLGYVKREKLPFAYKILQYLQSI
ncbi:FAD-dependent monooxygenase [Psittacicella gerlachiana]|uniref:FAD-binding domain-containing protein n=1 Tax=Psittacicella gerlachiana TaxID=2028574 RepID=A0A3A1YFQ5_9GAMM|nr:FAD-dependent monooxygenase [Psittacicella gerlachiana]RIY36018.1 hypothetical protein CKF59_03080 [Psittacicella gerlachiana]